MITIHRDSPWRLWQVFERPRIFHFYAHKLSCPCCFMLFLIVCLHSLKKALSVEFSKASLMYNALLLDRRIVCGFHKRQKRHPALKKFWSTGEGGVVYQEIMLLLKQKTVILVLHTYIKRIDTPKKKSEVSWKRRWSFFSFVII